MSVLKCIECGEEYSLEKIRYLCECGGLLEVIHDLAKLEVSREIFDSRLGSQKFPYNSGVWRYKELILPDVDDKHIVSRPEGNTSLYCSAKIS